MDTCSPGSASVTAKRIEHGSFVAVCRMPDRQKGAAILLTIVSMVALAMAILGAWWGFVVVPKHKAAEDRETQTRIETLVASKSFLSSPSSKLSCDAVGGTWKLGQNALSTGSISTQKPGQNTPETKAWSQWIRVPDYCSLPATDGGKACMSSSECESFCVGRMVLGELFSAQCHPYRNTSANSFGTLLVVENGRPFFELSIKPEAKRTPGTYEVVGAKIEVKVVDGSKLKVGEKVRATQALRDKPWFPTFGIIPGT